MNKKELSFTKNSRFSMYQIEKMDELTEKYNFKNVSELIRESVFFFIKYLEHKEKYKDPEEMRKFAEEFDPLIKAKKNEDKMKILIGGYTDEDLERFYFMCSQERKGRIKSKYQNTKDKEMILDRGGEIIPKIGYEQGCTNNIEFYRPITPDSKEWDYLSIEDKISLRIELEEKLIKRESIHQDPKDRSNPHRLFMLRKTIEDITKKISEEKEL